MQQYEIGKEEKFSLWSSSQQSGKNNTTGEKENTDNTLHSKAA